MPLCSRVFVCDAMVLWCYGAAAIDGPVCKVVSMGQFTAALGEQGRAGRLRPITPPIAIIRKIRKAVCTLPHPQPPAPCPLPLCTCVASPRPHAPHYSCTALTGTAATYIFSPPASPTVCSTCQVPVVPSTCRIPFTTPPPPQHLSRAARVRWTPIHHLHLFYSVCVFSNV